MALKYIQLTDVEIRHLQEVLQEHKLTGEYHGEREQYWKRHDRIVDKLSNGTSDNPNSVQEHRERAIQKLIEANRGR